MESDSFLQLGKLHIGFLKNMLNGTYRNQKIWQVEGILLDMRGGVLFLKKET